MQSGAQIAYETSNGPYGFDITPANDLSDGVLWQIADLAAAEVPYTVTATHVTRADIVVVDRPEES